MAKRRRQDSLRASWLAMNSSNGIGLFLVHNPPGERKSGMPHSVEMPAPVKGTMTLALPTRSLRLVIAELRSGAIIFLTPSALSYIKRGQSGATVRPYHAVSAHYATRAQSRRGTRFLLQGAGSDRSPPAGRREEQVHLGVP